MNCNIIRNNIPTVVCHNRITKLWSQCYWIARCPSEFWLIGTDRKSGTLGNGWMLHGESGTELPFRSYRINVRLVRPHFQHRCHQKDLTFSVETIHVLWGQFEYNFHPEYILNNLEILLNEVPDLWFIQRVLYPYIHHTLCNSPNGPHMDPCKPYGPRSILLGCDIRWRWMCDKRHTHLITRFVMLYKSSYIMLGEAS